MAEKSSMQWEAFLRPPQFAKLLTAMAALGSFLALESAIGSLNVPGRDGTHTFHAIVTFVTFAIMIALIVLAFFFFWPYIMDPRKAFLAEIVLFDVPLTVGLLITTILITIARVANPFVYRACGQYFMRTFCDAHLAATILSYLALLFSIVNLITAIVYSVRNKEVYDWYEASPVIRAVYLLYEYMQQQQRTATERNPRCHRTSNDVMHFACPSAVVTLANTFCCCYELFFIFIFVILPKIYGKLQVITRSSDSPT